MSHSHISTRPWNDLDSERPKQTRGLDRTRRPSPRPFIKWVGGKTQLLPDLLARLPAIFSAYHEPFLGGAALFFALSRSGRLAEAKVHLSDLNSELVDTYRGVKARALEVIRFLGRHRYDQEHFYRVRAQDPYSLSLPARAARMIYLNRAGFNGLYRVNRNGKFNVPFGRYTNPTICDSENLRASSKALASVALHQGSFGDVLTRAQPGDFVYLDPPYVPASETANFVSYARQGFDLLAQEQLACTYEALHNKGCLVMMSNSETPWVKKRYRAFDQSQVEARRNVNSAPDRRGPVGELIVTNYATGRIH